MVLLDTTRFVSLQWCSRAGHDVMRQRSCETPLGQIIEHSVDQTIADDDSADGIEEHFRIEIARCGGALKLDTEPSIEADAKYLTTRTQPATAQGAVGVQRALLVALRSWQATSQRPTAAGRCACRFRLRRIPRSA